MKDSDGYVFCLSARKTRTNVKIRFTYVPLWVNWEWVRVLTIETRKARLRYPVSLLLFATMAERSSSQLTNGAIVLRFASIALFSYPYVDEFAVVLVSNADL